MAWNIDKCLHAKRGAAVEDANTLLANASTFLWAVLPVAGKHHLMMWWTGLDYQLLPQADTLTVDAQQRTLSSPAIDIEVGFVSQLAAYGDFAYVGVNEFSLKQTTFDSIQVYNTAGKLVETLDCPTTMNSNIVVDNSKLWMVSSTPFNNDRQSLFWYDLVQKTWQFAGIPVRHQERVRFLARDHDGHILICDYNNLSVTRFSNTGVFQATTRIAPSGGGANREPSFITIDDLRNVYISSFQGMISKLNTTNNTAAPFSTGMGDVHAFADDGTYLWIATKKRPSSVSWQGRNLTCYYSHVARGTAPDVEMWQDGGDGAAGVWTPGAYYVDDQEDVLRIKKSTQEIRHFSTMERDILIQPTAAGAVAGKKVNNILVTPATLLMPSYVWMIFEDNQIMGWPSSGSMYRDNHYEMKGYAMMSVGQYDYIGE